MRIAGHPAHFVLSHFPVALLLTAAGFDAAALAWPDLGEAGRLCMLVGVILALPTAMTGLLDWMRLEGESARKLAERHMLLVSAAVVTFASALWLRATGHSATVWLACDAVGSALLVAGAWHGGELVVAHGVGTSLRRAVTKARDDGSNEA